MITKVRNKNKGERLARFMRKRILVSVKCDVIDDIGLSVGTE